MKTILVVDDEFDVLSAIKVVLEDEGYKVLTAGNGREALALVDEAQPSLLITDTTMPYLTGYELLEKIEDQHKQIPSILMSNVHPERKRRDLKYNATLTKPFTLEELVSAVRKVLR